MATREGIRCSVWQPWLNPEGQGRGGYVLAWEGGEGGCRGVFSDLICNPVSMEDSDSVVSDERPAVK